MIVLADAEFRRIRDLPRRPEPPPAVMVDLATELHNAFRKPKSSAALRPIQVRALAEYIEHGKLVGEIGAGFGKALLSFLLMTAGQTFFGKQRGLLIVPAKLREQTLDVHAMWSEHFAIPPLLEADEKGLAPLRLISYEMLSLASKASFLSSWDFDMLILDEAHLVSRMPSARARRLFRFVHDARKRGRDIHFVPLSGTMRRRRLAECAHIYEAALQKGSPLPQHYPTLESWGNCLDEGINEDIRYKPGALLELCAPDEAGDLAGWRRAFRRRLVETPGVVATSEEAVDIPLVMQARTVAVPVAIREALERLEAEWVLPNGDEVDSPLNYWNFARQIATGFSYRWVPPPPQEWMNARRDWAAFVRTAIASAPRALPLDSPLQVWQAVEAGRFGYVPEFERWKALRGTFEPNPVPFWIDEYLLRDAEEWALSTGGIVWCGFTSAHEKGEDVEQAFTGRFKQIPFFGAGDDRIRTHQGPCAASIRSHGTGKNLTQWNRALIMCMPSSGSTVEQLLARHHRIGQTADMVLVEFYQHTPAMREALTTALKDARFAQDVGGQPQRLLSCNLLTEDGHALYR